MACEIPENRSLWDLSRFRFTVARVDTVRDIGPLDKSGICEGVWYPTGKSLIFEIEPMEFLLRDRGGSQ